MFEQNDGLQKLFYNSINFLVNQRTEISYYIEEMIYEGRYGERLQGHDGNVNDVAFSPQSNSIVSGGDDGTVKVWQQKENSSDLNNNFQSTDLKHECPVWSVTFSNNDGQLIASGDAEGIIKIWDRKNQVLITELKDKNASEQVILKLSFSPNNQLIASANWDNQVRVWQINNLESKILFFCSHGDKVYAVNFSNDGSKIASACGDNVVRVWSDQGQLLHELKNEDQSHAYAVFDIAFSSDDTMIAAAYYDKTVKLWDVANEKIIKEFTHEDTVYGVSFNHDSQMIASATKDGFVKVWSINNNEKPLAQFWHGVQVNSVNFSPDGKTIASAGNDKNVRLWTVDKRIGEIQEQLVDRLSRDSYKYFWKILEQQINKQAGLNIRKYLLEILTNGSVK